MSLVPSVMELILAEFLYLQYEDAEKPIYPYINSMGTTKVTTVSNNFCLLHKLFHISLMYDVTLFGFYKLYSLPKIKFHVSSRWREVG